MLPLISVFAKTMAGRGERRDNTGMAHRMADVERLTPDEQLDLIGELWDRLSSTPSRVPITDAQRQEIDRRSDELDEDVQAGRPVGIPWEEVFRQLRSRRP